MQLSIMPVIHWVYKVTYVSSVFCMSSLSKIMQPWLMRWRFPCLFHSWIMCSLWTFNIELMIPWRCVCHLCMMYNDGSLLFLVSLIVVVKYTSICIAHLYAKRLKCAQTWITQFYLQTTPCLPLLPSLRTSPPFCWYSFYRHTEGRRLSRPGWLVTYRNKVPPPRVEPGHGHPSQY